MIPARYVVLSLLLSFSTFARADPQTDSGLSTCGNGQLDFGEACDGAALAGSTCASETLGALPGGSLKCTPDCRTILTTGCNASAPPDSGAGGAQGAGGSVGSGGTSTAAPRDAGNVPANNGGSNSGDPAANGGGSDVPPTANGGDVGSPNGNGPASGGEPASFPDGGGAILSASQENGGCGCRVGDSHSTDSTRAALSALALAGLLVRRRRNQVDRSSRP